MNRTDGTKSPFLPSGSLARDLWDQLWAFTSTQSVQFDRCVDLSVLAVLAQSSSLKSLLTIDAILSVWTSNILVYRPGEQR